MIYVDPPENRFLWMDFPAPERIEALSDELREKHADCFMVWNLSGTSYDTEPFGRQVVALKFSGHLCLWPARGGGKNNFGGCPQLFGPSDFVVCPLSASQAVCKVSNTRTAPSTGGRADQACP